MEKLKANVVETLARFQNLATVTRTIKLKAEQKEDVEYVAPFIADCNKQVSEVDKVCKALTRMIEEETDNTKLPKLIESMERCETKALTINEWSKNFGIGGGSKRRRRNS